MGAWSETNMARMEAPGSGGQGWTAFQCCCILESVRRREDRETEHFLLCPPPNAAASVCVLGRRQGWRVRKRLGGGCLEPLLSSLQEAQSTTQQKFPVSSKRCRVGVLFQKRQHLWTVSLPLSGLSRLIILSLYLKMKLILTTRGEQRETSPYPFATWLFAVFRTELHGGKRQAGKGRNCNQKASSITCTIVWALRVFLEFSGMDRLIRCDRFLPLALWPPGTSPVNNCILVERGTVSSCIPFAHPWRSTS